MSDLKIDPSTGLVLFTPADIRSWSPCYDPDRYFSDDVVLDAVKVLQDERIPFPDRLWAVCRNEIVSDRVLRLFAVWCARQVLHLMTDPRSIAALEVAERYANGEATDKELLAAVDAAVYAAWSAAVYAAGDAAVYAAVCAARAAARAAAGVAAVYAAGDAARDAQKDRLIEMIKAEGRERLAGVVRESAQ